MPLTRDEKKLWKIFHPHAWDEEVQAKRRNYRLAHYTSAESLFKIFKSDRFWMRKAVCMNDFSEVQHGLDCIIKTYDQTAQGAKFKKTLNKLFRGFTGRIESLFNKWIPSIYQNTYIACFSLHAAEDDRFGRLSMWRAYAANTGLALIFKLDSSTDASDILKVDTSPVAYMTDAEFSVEFDRITNNIEANPDLIRQQGSKMVEAYVFRMLRFAAVSVKNPCFREEREWRLLYSPDLFGGSEDMIETIESITGVPQSVFSIPFSAPEGIGFAKQLDRIIIGPTQFPYPVANALLHELKRFGVEEPASKIVIADIPLRA